MTISLNHNDLLSNPIPELDTLTSLIDINLSLPKLVKQLFSAIIEINLTGGQSETPTSLNEQIEYIKGTISKSLSEISKNSIQELISYSKPPSSIETVGTFAFVLQGGKGKKSKGWASYKNAIKNMLTIDVFSMPKEHYEQLKDEMDMYPDLNREILKNVSTLASQLFDIFELLCDYGKLVKAAEALAPYMALSNALSVDVSGFFAFIKCKASKMPTRVVANVSRALCQIEKIPEFFILDISNKAIKTLQLSDESLEIQKIGVLELVMYLGESGKIEEKMVSEIEGVKWVVFKLFKV